MILSGLPFSQQNSREESCRVRMRRLAAAQRRARSGRRSVDPNYALGGGSAPGAGTSGVSAFLPPFAGRSRRTADFQAASFSGLSM